jgi:diguanylate cyclase (GGDEF)-like protein
LWYPRRMPFINYDQFATLGLEATLVSLLLLALFRLRTRFGLSLLFITLGAFQQMQMTLALSFYVELTPGILVSPGSVVLFTSSLFAFLLIYIREDASEARKLIYGLAIANLSLEALSYFFARQMNMPGLHILYNFPRELLVHNPRVLLAGTAALLVDGIVVIILYEWVSRLISRFLFLRIYVSMGLALVLDTLIFATGSFWGQPEFVSLFLSGLAGKILMSVFYAAVLTLYLRYFEKPEYLQPRRHAQIQDIFEILTYRQKYEALRQRVVRDPLTGLYNRAFFEDVLGRELKHSYERGRPLALMLLDVDHFKEYNDTYGHPEGDRVLAFLGASLLGSLRTSDMACRYGGEELALILPDSDIRFAQLTAERIRRNLSERWEQVDPRFPGTCVTVTIGAAFFPEEASSASALVRLADERLYMGKRAGRDRIVVEDIRLEIPT